MYRAEEKELAKQEYMRLINTAHLNRNYRLELLLQTICGTGIRVSEVPHITVEAMKKGEAVVWLKGKTHSVFFVKQLRRKLLEYAQKQGIQSGAIFITRTGKPMNRTNIWKEMKSLCKQATEEYRKYQQKTLSEVERDYLDAIKLIESKIENK